MYYDFLSPRWSIHRDHPQATTITDLYTYRAQLTFGLPVSEEVNVAALFTKWVEKSCASLTASSLLPFDSEQGQQVKSPV